MDFANEFTKIMEGKKMKAIEKRSKRSASRTALFLVTAVALVGTALLVGSSKVEANHPVLVEGNCDSPVPGTTLVTVAGTCGITMATVALEPPKTPMAPTASSAL